MLSGGGRTRVRRWLVTTAALAVVTAALPAAPAHAAGGTIAGRVTGPGGGPLADVCVTVGGPFGYPYSPSPIASARTPADGTYTLSAPAGTYMVAFADCGGRDLVTSYWGGARYGSGSRLTIGEGEHRSGIDGALVAGGSMSGRVTNTSGEPLSSSHVLLRLGGPMGASYPEDTYVQSKPDGTWVARGVPAGTYHVSFGITYPSYAGVLYGDTPDVTRSPDVRVAVGQATTGIDARLGVGGSISGVVRDDEGRPHERVCVSARASLEYGNLQFGARTADDGTYRLDRVTPGTYRVQFSDCGGVTAPSWHPAAKTFGDATPVVVGEGAAVTGVDGVFARGIYVAGTVRDVHGAPLPNVGVSLYDGITGSYTGRGAFTDATGRYRIVGLRGTVYKLHFYGGDDSLELVERWWPGVPGQDAALPVSFVAGVSVDGVDVTLPRGGRIRGRITDTEGAPAAGLCVVANDPLTRQSHSTHVDLDGGYLLKGLDVGAYQVSHRTCSDTANYAPAYYGGTDDQATADLVPVVLGEETTGIDDVAEPGATLTGTVRDAAGAPIQGICARPSRFGPLIQNGGARTTETGRYTLVGLAPHTDYRIVFSDCRMAARYVTVWSGGADSMSDAAEVDVRVGQPAEVDATMTLGGSFSGTVYDQFGLPLRGVCIHAVDSAGRYRGTWHTDQNGRYVVGGLRAGTFSAVFVDCGAGLVRSSTRSAGTFEVRAGEDTPGIDHTVMVVTTPKAPVDVVVAPGDASATVTWRPPADTGNSPLTAFQVRAADGTVVATTSASARTAKVSGLTNGTTYAFTVNAVNVKGPGDDSAPVSVLPRPPARLSVTAPSSVVSGALATVSGRLTTKSGAAMAGARVSLLGRRRGSTAAMTRISAATTSPTGAYRIAIRPAYPMEYVLSYAGNTTVGPVRVTKVVPVSPRLTLSVSGRSVSVGVSPAGGGGRARLQVLRSTGWVSVVGADLPSTGRVTLRAPAGGLYRVVVVRSGWATATSTRLRLA